MLFAGAYLINQVHDIDTDRLNGKLGFLQREMISARAMTVGFVMLCLPAIAVGALISELAVGVFLLLFIVSYAYSAPPFRLKDRPLGGLFANAFAYGLLVSTAAVSDSGMSGIRLLGWYIPLYFVLAVGSVYCVTTVPDRDGDRAVGKRTLAVVLGRAGALSISLALMLASIWTAVESARVVLVGLSAFAAMIIVLALVTGSDKFVAAAAKLPLLLLTLLAGFFYPGYLLFVVALLFATRIYYKRRFHMAYPRAV
jgi:4-hydroxybenzoate polyprenyltransferase